MRFTCTNKKLKQNALVYYGGGYWGVGLLLPQLFLLLFFLINFNKPII